MYLCMRYMYVCTYLAQSHTHIHTHINVQIQIQHATVHRHVSLGHKTKKRFPFDAEFVII